MDVSELEACVFARTASGDVDLFALSLAFRVHVEVDVERDRLVFWIDGTDGEDSNTLPDSIRGGVDLGVAYEAVDFEDEALLDLGWRVLPALGPYLAAALEELEIPPVPLPSFAFEQPGGALASPTGAGTTLVGIDTNGGPPDWLCILR